jgi:mannose-6-phosphate isomerase
LKPGVTREAFRAALETGGVAPLLNAIKVRAGDCHYLKSGTVHALGAGILAAEVQTPSDTTFRVFDWNRLGPDGKARALHVDAALECIDFSGAPVPAVNAGGGFGSPVGTRLVACDYSTMDRVDLPPGDTQAVSPAMAVWMILEGQGVITCDGAGPTAFARGDTVLLPAGMTGAEVRTIARCSWIEARVPVAAA